jgi:hypothetical protein
MLTAAGAAAATGARVFTATSSQGLLYGFELLYTVAGWRVPFVLVNVSRGLASPITLEADHDDVLAARDSGCLQLHAETCQEVLDSILIGYRLAEDPRVLLPVIVNLDGFSLSFTREPVDVPDAAGAAAYVGLRAPPRVHPRRAADGPGGGGARRHPLLLLPLPDAARRRAGARRPRGGRSRLRRGVRSPLRPDRRLPAGGRRPRAGHVELLRDQGPGRGRPGARRRRPARPPPAPGPPAVPAPQSVRRWRATGVPSSTRTSPSALAGSPSPRSPTPSTPTRLGPAPGLRRRAGRQEIGEAEVPPRRRGPGGRRRGRPRASSPRRARQMATLRRIAGKEADR